MNQLIAFEGIDGTGKTTITNRLCQVKGFLYFRTPEGDISSIRKYIDSGDYMTRFFYYMACNYDASRKLTKLLVDKSIVVDRYFYSTFAYHNILLGRDTTIYLKDSGLRIPDKTFLLIADKETIMRRLKDRKTEGRTDKKLEKDIDLLIKIQEEYLRICTDAQVIDTSALNEQETLECVLRKI